MSDYSIPRRSPIGFHVTMRLSDDRPIAVSQDALRIVARAMHEQGAHRGLHTFGPADNHLHALLAASRAEVGAFCRYMESSLVWQLNLGARFERARIRALQSQRHAINAFQYVLRQGERHGLDIDPAREGTSIPDMVGFRVLPTSNALIANVRRALPRIHRADIIACFPAIADAFDVSQTTPLDVLAQAATAAFALPDLRGRTSDAARARRAAVHAPSIDTSIKDLSDALQLRPRAIRALRELPIEINDVRAVRSQAALFHILRQQRTSAA